VSDAELLVELVAELRDGGVDLEPTVLEGVERGDRARVILDQTKADLLVRLHNRPDDFAATRALHAVNTAAARLGGDDLLSSRGHRSLLRLLRPRVLGVLAVGALVAFLLTRVETTLLLYLVFIGASLAIGLVCWTTLVWMVYAWRSPAAFDDTRLPAEDLETHQSFSLIVPARHEEKVLEGTLSRIVQTEHPAFEVLVVVGTDDPMTGEVAERVAAAHPDLVRVVLDDSWPKNKPRALNAALPYCRGEIIGVFDAEDDVNPALIERVDQCFQESGADVVQAGVQLTNIRSSWFAVRNALEYYFWFRSRLHFHARAGFIPLGGNTVFVRTNVLRAVGGWDAECLAEDCELGVRLSSLGAKTVVFYEPELATREETPPNLGAFVRQRTRWSQGYLQTLSRNYWRRLPLKQRALGLSTLAMPYMMALVWIMIPLAIATALIVKASVVVSLLSFLPAIPMFAVLAVEVAGLGELCRSFGLRARVRDYGRLALSLPIYQCVLAFAASRAVIREARGVRGWEKTAHFGLHLAAPDARLVSETPVARVPDVLAWHADHDGRDGRDGRDGHDGRDGRDGRDGNRSMVGCAADVGAMSRGAGGADTVWTVYEAAPAPVLVKNGSTAPNGAGNDRSKNGASAIADLAAPTAGEPLWMRLKTGLPNGSAVLTPPAAQPIHRAGRDETRATGLGSFLGKFRASRAAIALPLLLLFAFVGLVQAVNLAHWPATFFDEGTYISNAWAVPHGALSNYTYGYGHPPLGWLMVSLWTWTSGLFGNTISSVLVGRQLMAALSIISCFLLYVFARRLGIARIFAAAAVVLFALAPVALYFHRLVLIDNPGVTFALAALVLALSPRRRLWIFAASGACFAASVLSKESMLVLLPVLLLAAVQNSDRRTRRYCLTLLGSFLLLTLLAYPLYAALKGELLPGPGHVSLVGEVQTQLFTRKATGSVFDPQSQTYGIVHYWLHLDPWLLGSAFLLAPIALVRRTTRVAALAFLIQCAMVLRPGYLPFMYVIGLLPFAAVVVAGTAETLWRFVISGPQQVAAGRRRWRVVADWAPWRLAPVLRAGAAAVLVALLGAFAIGAAPGWAGADRAAMTLRLDGPSLAAKRWLLRNVDHSERLLVADDYWVFLIEQGYDAHPVKGGFFSRTVVFYWPFDFDPAVKREFPQGWKDLDYVVSTEGMRNDATEVPRTAQALEHSRVVVSFGRGSARIDIRQIEHTSPAPAVVPPADATATPD
jgi:cellulose synthase/poly-beta-1,6-N-acetylglucosamine synthase-like glycosyltransferase